MAFFDLNIPYHESSSRTPNKTAAKTARLRLAVKAIELGYSGAAYNRTIAGAMAESHRCATPLFPLASVLNLSPSLSSPALHRRLLGVPEAAPFRQYTRVTVVVESAAQAAALNSGNPVLKSYDLVAVRPMNQHAFEQACTVSEVDLISIDFSEKLPFRLKQHMVKAAIERGIYFEILYSALLLDVQLRRQMITGCKLLVDWTRGKNLIISSAAPSVTEMRGPYDVANLSSLLGLSMEYAKAALSKNCRTLIAKALRKKHYYKEAIRVEIIPSGEEFDSNEHWHEDWMKWDPISSGEGDLFFDEMAKSFSAAKKVAKTVRPIDFASIIDKLPSHGLQVQELKPLTEATVHSFETDSSFADTEPTELAKTFCYPSEDQNPLLDGMAKSFSAVNKAKTTPPIELTSIMDKLPSHGWQVQKLKPVTGATVRLFETDSSCGDSELTKLTKTLIDPSEDPKSVDITPAQHQINSCEDSVKLISSTHIQDYQSNDEKTVTQTIEDIEKFNDSDDLGIHVPPLGAKTLCFRSQNCIGNSQVDLLGRWATMDSSPMDIDIIGACEAVSDAENSGRPTNDVFPLVNRSTSSCSGVALGSQDYETMSISKEMNLEVEEVLPLTSCELDDMYNGQLTEITAAPDALSYDKEYENDDIATKKVPIVTDTEVKGDLSRSLCVLDEENNHLQEMYDASVALPILVSQDEMSGSNDHSSIISEPSNEVAMEEQMETEDPAKSSSPVIVLNGSSGKRKPKRRMPSQAFVFPFKRLPYHTPFKRKSHKPKNQRKNERTQIASRKPEDLDSSIHRITC